MSRKFMRHQIVCPYCEGTKRAVNFFDPLESQLPSKFVIDRKERSPSGRELYDWECEQCEDGILSYYSLEYIKKPESSR